MVAEIPRPHQVHLSISLLNNPQVILGLPNRSRDLAYPVSWTSAKAPCEFQPIPLGVLHTPGRLPLVQDPWCSPLLAGVWGPTVETQRRSGLLAMPAWVCHSVLTPRKTSFPDPTHNSALSARHLNQDHTRCLLKMQSPRPHLCWPTETL